MIKATSLCSQRERETLQFQFDLAHAHAELNVNDEEELQDEEQEWDPAAAEFMARCLWVIYTKSGNATIGSDKRHGDGDYDEAGSEISLLPLNNKGMYAEGLFLNLYQPRGGVPVAEEIMAGQAQVGGQEWDPAAAEFIVWRLWIFQTEFGNATVGSGKRHGDGYDDDTGYEISLLPLNNKGIYAEGLFPQFGSAARWYSCCSINHGGTSASWWPGISQSTFRLESTE